MMAKMFYRFDEARQVLGMTDEQLRQLTREGKLREFRDGTQVMYKADQVDTLKRELGLGGESVDLGPSDTGGPIGLVDSRGESAGGSVISLSDTTSKDDTATDMGLSGSGGLGGSGSGLDLASSQSATSTGIGLASSKSGSTGGSLSGGSLGGTKMGSKGGSGISVLGLDEGGNADANAATAMGGSFGGEPGLEAMGSGSGLLDLSRERDDTSLGAPVLSEFNTGSSGSRSGSGGAISGAPLSASPVAATARAGGVPVYLEEASNFAGFAAGASAGAALFALVAIYCVAAAAMRAEPTLLSAIGIGGTKVVPMLYVLGAGLVASLLFGAIGFFVGKKR